MEKIKLKNKDIIIHLIRSKNVKNNNNKFKVDMFGLGIIYSSIFNNDSDFDIFINLLWFMINISIRYKRK